MLGIREWFALKVDSLPGGVIPAEFVYENFEQQMVYLFECRQAHQETAGGPRE